MKKILFIFSLIFIFGCNSDEILNSEIIDIAELKKQWAHSREEEKDSIQIYRPIDYKEFSPTRYRQMYSFAESGKCEYLVLSPNDAHYFESGTWTYNEDKQLLVIYDLSKQTKRVLKIILVTKDQLKFVQIK